MHKIRSWTIALAVAALPTVACAHSGSALDDAGCHPDHRNGTYHCHRGDAAGYTFPNRAAMEQAVRTGTFPEKSVDEEGFFSRLWPFGGEDGGDEGEPAPSNSGESKAGPDGSAATAAGQNPYEQRLKILQGLYEMGLISKEEYEAKRKAVLDEL